MIKLSMPKILHKQIQNLGYQPTLKPTLLNSQDYTQVTWHWHCRNKKIYGRNCLILIEDSSLYTLCFFDMSAHELRNLDITLWFRFLNAIQFMSQYDPQQTIVSEPDLLTLIRSMMTPLVPEYKLSRHISNHAAQVFSLMEIFFHRPLAIPLPLHQEICFDWLLNTDLLSQHPELMSFLNHKYILQNDLMAQLLLNNAFCPHAQFFEALQRQCRLSEPTQSNVYQLV